MATQSELRAAYDKLKKSHSFQPGDLVQWKRDLRNRKVPRYEQPAIVCGVLSTPVYDENSKKDAGSGYFLEPLDIQIGLFDEDNDTFSVYHVDSRRLEPFDPSK